MARTINVHDAKTHFSRLLDDAHAGEEIILAKAGKPSHGPKEIDKLWDEIAAVVLS